MKWTFFFEGRKGIAESYQGGAYIFWGGMGFHLNAAAHDLRQAIQAAKPKGGRQ